MERRRPGLLPSTIRTFAYTTSVGGTNTSELEKIPAAEFLSNPRIRETSSLVLVESNTQHELEAIVNLGATRDTIERIRQAWGIPSAFLTKICKPGSLSCFAHHLERSALSAEGHRETTSLNIGFRWGEGHELWIVVFGRYDLKTRTVRVLVSWRGIMRNLELEGCLNEKCDSLGGNPLEIFPLLFELCGRISHKDWAPAWGIGYTGDASKESIENLSKDIYRALDDTRWLHKASQQLVGIGDRCSEVISTTSRNHLTPPMGEVGEEITDILNRLRLNHHTLLYIERMLESQFQLHQNMLANREAKATGKIAVAGQRDSLLMKMLDGHNFNEALHRRKN